MRSTPKIRNPKEHFNREFKNYTLQNLCDNLRLSRFMVVQGHRGFMEKSKDSINQ